MKTYIKYLGGFLVLYAYILTKENLIYEGVIDYWILITVIAMLLTGIYFLFFLVDRTKTAIIEDKKLIIQQRKKNLVTIDLTHLSGIAKGMKSIRIRHQNGEQTFKYSEFDSESVERLKSLG